jgi:hypothetical protein
VSALSCVAAASLAQVLLEPEIGFAAWRLEQRIEQQLERRGAPAPEKQPERSHEIEAIDPWELVCV